MSRVYQGRALTDAWMRGRTADQRRLRRQRLRRAARVAGEGVIAGLTIAFTAAMIVLFLALLLVPS